jgi:hypothetical protein
MLPTALIVLPFNFYFIHSPFVKLNEPQKKYLFSQLSVSCIFLFFPCGSWPDLLHPCILNQRHKLCNVLWVLQNLWVKSKKLPGIGENIKVVSPVGGNTERGLIKHLSKIFGVYFYCDEDEDPYSCLTEHEVAAAILAMAPNKKDLERSSNSLPKLWYDIKSLYS